MRLQILKYLLVLSTMFLLTSCNKNRVFEKYIEIPDKVWERDFRPEFKLAIEDTTQIYNMFVNVRNLGYYPFRNIWVFIHTTTPTENISHDTLECVLANEKGEWLGDGLGNLWDSKILWKQNTRFSTPGTYKIEFEHAMRSKKIPGIMDMGLTVETVNLPK